MPPALDIKQYLDRYGAEGYSVLDPENLFNSKSKIKVKCPLGHEYQTKPAKWALGRRCHKCSVPKGFERNSWDKLLQDVIALGYDIKYEGVSRSRKIIGVCPIGHQIDAFARVLLRNKNPCRKCSGLNRAQKQKQETLRNLLELASSNSYSIKPLEAFSIHSQVEVTCPAGHVYELKSTQGFLEGRRCKICSNNGTSRPQQEIEQYIKELLPGVEVLSSCRVLKSTPRPFEIDIWVPSLNFGIEYDGLYWHSTAAPWRRAGAAALKAKLASEQGISLFSIYEDQWERKNELVKAMIRWRIGKFNGISLNSRDLEVKTLTKNSQFKDFFNRNHLNGHRKASFAIGLFYQDKLVACSSFSRTRSGNCELIRMATDYDYNVRGSASRMLSKVPVEIVTYSDNRLGVGKIYSSLGFTEVTKSTKPSYYYTDLNTRIWRANCMRVNTPEILEQYPTEELQALNGVFSQKFFGDNRPLYKIEDAGHRKWVRPAILGVAPCHPTTTKT